MKPIGTTMGREIKGPKCLSHDRIRDNNQFTNRKKQKQMRLFRKINYLLYRLLRLIERYLDDLYNEYGR